MGALCLEPGASLWLGVSAPLFQLPLLFPGLTLELFAGW